MSENKYEQFKEGINILTTDKYFQSLAQTIPHFFCIVDPENYEIQYISKLLSGFKFENVLGVNALKFIFPEHAELFRKGLQEAKETRKPVVVEIEGGSTEKSKGWFRTHISIIEGPDHSISNLILLAENITENKLKEIENINKSERIKAIINNTRDIICSIDADYNLMEFNTVFAEMIRNALGIEMQPGMPVLKFIDPAKHAHLKVIYNRVLNGEVCTDIETFTGPRGGDVVMETSYNPIFDASKKNIGITIFSKDVTERAKGDQKIKNTLKEKELLLSEIHHRIKNNLAMVSSLLQLQEMNISNAEAKEVLTMSRKRIKSTALIHELLYRSESFQNVNLKDYLSELFQHININENIQLKFTGDEPKLSLNNAMPFALLLNEIMLNSFKHSYTEKNKGNIEIIVKVGEGKFRMTYKDFAGNFPDNIDFKNSSTTGLTLIHTFAEQLEGNVELYNRNPPEYLIEIPLNENQ